MRSFITQLCYLPSCQTRKFWQRRKRKQAIPIPISITVSNECFCTVYYCVLYSSVFKRQYPCKQIKVIWTGHTVKVLVRYFTPTGRVLAHKSIRIEVGRSPATSGGHFCHESGPPLLPLLLFVCFLLLLLLLSCRTEMVSTRLHKQQKGRHRSAN